VLDLENDKPSPRELRLCFFRRGRMILATPIESADDMTMMSLGIKSQNNATVGCDSSSSIIQSGVTVSRKAKMRFWAISLAYEILNDEVMRKHYHEWRLWNPRLSPPSFEEEASIIIGQSTGSIASSNEKLSAKELSEIIIAGGGVQRSKDRETDVESRISASSSMYSNANSILHPPRYGNKKMNKITTNRKIRWNEEVEELVILDDDYKENDSIESIDRIESWNDPELQDIGGLQLARNDDSTLESLDLSMLTIRDLDESKLTSLNRTYGNNISIHTENSADSSLSESVHTSNSSRRLLSKENKRRFNAKPIRVTESDAEPIQQLSSDCIKIEGGKDACSNFEIELPSKKIRKSRHHASESVSSWNTEQSTMIEGGKDASSNFRIKIKAPPKDTAASRSKASARRNYRKAVPHDYDSNSEFRKDFMTSNINANDCAAGLAVDLDCNPFPLRRKKKKIASSSDGDNHSHHNNNRNNDDDHDAETFPMLSDFHGHLTNYITEAVSEMKDGLSTLGKKWDELDFDKIGGNNFFLQGPEIDALLGILNEESSNSPYKNQCWHPT